MVYKITEYNLKDKKLFTFEEMPHLEFKEREGGQSPIFVYKGEKTEARVFHGYFSLKKPDGAIAHTEKFMPYFADVTEDLPSSVKFEPKTYKNCQLLVEKYGEYLQFYHEPTKEILRIAINSNTYVPVK